CVDPNSSRTVNMESLRYISSLADPRVQGWPLMDSPVTCLTILAAYVSFATTVGPHWMRDRKPYQLKPLIMAYNLFNVLASGFFAFNLLRLTYLGGGYNWACQTVDYSDSPNATTLTKLVWWYLLLKIADLLDTVFFVLTKKQSHVTVLHVAHHSMVVGTVWIVLKFACGGQNILTGALNSIIHVIMYSYYFLSLMGPSVQKYLWWKRYLTQVQLIQFVVLVVHAILPLFVRCGFPTFFSWLCIAECAFFFLMFARFYCRSYKRLVKNC
ncbi:fatty acyl-CoA elongase, putative, partial [Ixodes scapularis]